MRKEAGFEVQDHIKLYYSDNSRIGEIIEKNRNLIADEVLASDIQEGKEEGYSKDWNINGEKANFTVVKV